MNNKKQKQSTCVNSKQCIENKGRIIRGQKESTMKHSFHAEQQPITQSTNSNTTDDGQQSHQRAMGNEFTNNEQR